MPSTQWILSGLRQTKIKLLQWLCPTNPACSTFWLSLEILPWKWKFREAFIGQTQNDWFLWWAEVTRPNWKHLLCLISWDFCLLQLPKKKKKKSSCNRGKHVGCLANSIDQRLWIQFNHSNLWNIQAKTCVWLSLLSHHSWTLSSQKSSNKARKTFMIRPPTSLAPSPTAQGPSLTIVFGQ